MSDEHQDLPELSPELNARRQAAALRAAGNRDEAQEIMRVHRRETRSNVVASPQGLRRLFPALTAEELTVKPIPAAPAPTQIVRAAPPAAPPAQDRPEHPERPGQGQGKRGKKSQ
jgi:hypothetical protein